MVDLADDDTVRDQRLWSKNRSSRRLWLHHQGVEMRQKSVNQKRSSQRIVKDIRRATRERIFGRREDPYRAGRPSGRAQHRGAVRSVRTCPRACITTHSGEDSWKRQAEAGRSARAATSGEVKDLRQEAGALLKNDRQAGSGIAAAQKA